jgi:hypothetical protein
MVVDGCSGEGGEAILGVNDVLAKQGYLQPGHKKLEVGGVFSEAVVRESRHLIKYLSHQTTARTLRNLREYKHKWEWVCYMQDELVAF